MPGTVLRSRIFPAWKQLMLVLALAVLCPAPAFAQGASEVQAYLLSVKRLYEDFENESALRQIARAKTLPRTTEDDVMLSLYEGVIQADLSRWEESAAAFKTALSLRPDAQLPVKVSPKVEQHFEEVRKAVKQEVAAHAKPPSPPELPTPQPESSTVLPQPAGGLTNASAAVTERRFTRPQFLIPAITGGVLLVAGGTAWAMSRKELSRLNNDDPSLTTLEEADQAASRGRRLQNAGVGLLGAGAVGLGIAAGWYAFGPSPDKLSLKVGTDGTSAFVQGRWP